MVEVEWLPNFSINQMPAQQNVQEIVMMTA